MANYNAYKSKPGIIRSVSLGLAAIAGLAVIGVIAGGLAYSQSLRPVNSSPQTQLITIAPGTGVQRIAEQLAQAHLVKSAWGLQLYAHVHGLTGRFQAGPLNYC